MVMWFFTVAVVLILLILINSKSTENMTNESTPGPIPKIIHQTAPADQSKWNPVWKPCQDSWKRNFPDWEYKMWTDEDLDEFMKTNYDWFYPTFTNYPKKIMRIDAARYFILYEYGGIYADMDFECVKNFEHMLPKDTAFAAESPWFEASGEKYQNALMGSPARHEFWLKVFEDLKKHSHVSDVLNATGPEVIHRSAESNPKLFSPLKRENFAPIWDASLDAPNHDFGPLSISERNALTIKRFNTKPAYNVYSRHHGSCEWCIGAGGVTGSPITTESSSKEPEKKVSNSNMTLAD